MYTVRVLDWYLKRRFGDNELSVRLGRLVAPLLDARMVLRLTGMLATADGVLDYHRTLTPATTPEGRLVNILGFVQAWSMVVYYPLDNVYWLALHKVIKMSDHARDESSRYSCIAWLAYIVADMIMDSLKMRDILRRKAAIERSKYSQPLSMTDEQRAREREAISGQISDVALKYVTNACDLLMAVHWSLKSSPVPPIAVAVAGSVSSVAGLSLRWKYTK